MSPENNLQNFHPVNWLENYFRQEVLFDNEHLQPVLWFSLVWNLFETIACQKFAKEKAIRDSVNFADQHNVLNAIKYGQQLNYFRQRCLRFNTTEEYLERLFQPNKDLAMKNAVRKALDSEVNDVNNIVLALLFIAYRIRNNFFHGSKEIRTINMQTELFNAVNQLLTDYIDDVRLLYEQHPPR